MSKKFGIIAIILVIIGAIGGGIFGRLPVITSADTSLTKEKVVSDYSEALDVIDENYVGKIDHEKVTESSIQGMLWSLDPHSSFFTRDEFRKLYEEQSSQFYGIGVSILQHRDGVYVQSIIPNTPADKAGLHYGDRFLEIEGKDARKYTSAEVSKNVRGERGTPVNIKSDAPESKNHWNLISCAAAFRCLRFVITLCSATGLDTSVLPAVFRKPQPMSLMKRLKNLKSRD